MPTKRRAATPPPNGAQPGRQPPGGAGGTGGKRHKKIPPDQKDLRRSQRRKATQQTKPEASTIKLGPDPGNEDLESVESDSIFGDEKRQFKVIKKLGLGSFGVVVKAGDMKSNGSKALKIARLPNFVQEGSHINSSLLKEWAIYKTLTKKTPYPDQLLQILDIFECFDRQVLVLPVMRMTLYQYATRPEKSMPRSEVAYYMRQALEGLCFLHGHGIVHGSFKLNNMLLSSDLKTLKLCDMGAALEIKQGAIKDNCEEA